MSFAFLLSLLFLTVDASATAIAAGNISLSGFTITPASGTVVYDAPFASDVYSEARNSLGELIIAFDFSPDGAVATDAAVTWADASATADGPARMASAAANGDIPGAIVGDASSVGRGTLSNTFMITGGSGSVDVQFSASVSGGYNLSTDEFGLLASSELIFALLLDGSPVMFASILDAIGPSDSASASFPALSPQTVSLEFGKTYSLLIELDAESRVTNIPEPSGLLIVASGVILLTRLKHLIPGRSR
jgi:hypothetical protein